MTFENLERQGVDAAHVARVEGSSGVAPIWVEPDGTNRIIVVPGANDRVDPEAAAGAVRSLDGRPRRRRPARDPAAGDGGGLPRCARARRDRRSSTPRRRRRARCRAPRRCRLADPERDGVRDPRGGRVVRSGRRRGAGRLRASGSGRGSRSRSGRAAPRWCRATARSPGSRRSRSRRSTRPAPATRSSGRSRSGSRRASTSSRAIRLGILCASDSVTQARDRRAPSPHRRKRPRLLARAPAPRAPTPRTAPSRRPRPGMKNALSG